MQSTLEKPTMSESSEGKRDSSEEESNDTELADRVIERKVIRKCDMHVIPPITLLFVLSFLDRINIGNARIQGLEKDLNMKGNDYNIALLLFFVPYILLEVPSNYMLRKIAPSTWLSGLMVCWGIVTVCMGLTQNFAGLAACRFLLGIFESGFIPGCLYLISMYYRRFELQKRFTVFFCASIFGGAVSGLLAYALSNMAGIGGYNGWRWIFIIEGLVTIIAAAIAKLFIVDWPETSKFLNEREREILTRRLQEDASEATMNHLDKASLRRIFSDWKIYIGILMYLGVANTGYSTAFFAPTILSQLGFTAIRAQVYTIPVYVVACTATLIVAQFADRLRHRFSFIILGVVLGSIGYAILLAQQHVPVSIRYFALYLVMSGSYISQPVTLVWINNNLGGHYKRSVGAAMQIGLGNCGGIIASNIFITSEAPLYPVGFGTSLALLLVCGLASTILVIGLRLENKKRDSGERDCRYNLPKEELENLGDDHPSFRFTY